MDIAAAYLADIRRTFRSYKSLAERAIAQVPNDADLHRQLDPDSNSIAIIARHIGGNLRSRFRDFLTTDGEKPDRDRDAEFEMPERATRDEILRWWNDGWTLMLDALEALTPEDLARTITIRREEFLVVEALNRSATHTAYHVGQIVYLARHVAAGQWKSLTIPKGQSKSHTVGDFKTRGLAR